MNRQTLKRQAKQDVLRNLPIRYPHNKFYIAFYLNAIIDEAKGQ
jgi:hypothetical protein